MKALLLAAGLGTRLQPITHRIQKCLVPISGKPLIEYWLDNLSQTSITDFLINTHHHAYQMQSYIQRSKYASKVTLVHEENLLLTGGTILQNRDFINNKTFMLVHADNLCLCDFNAFIKAHTSRPKNTLITMMLFHTSNPESCGIVECDEEGIVQHFYEKVIAPPSNLANGAIYICEPEIIDFLVSLNQKEIDFSTEVIPHFLGRINTFLNKEYHRDIGTLESYATAQIDLYDKEQGI